MRTLSINNQKFRVNDGGAVRYDEEQELSETEKNLARKNIGAGNGNGGSLVSQIADEVLIVTLAANITAMVQDGILVVV